MKVLAAPSPTPVLTGRLREWNGGVPGHGEFVMLKTQPTDGSAPLEFSSKFVSRLWMSPDDELPPTVSGEACTLRQLIRQGAFPDPGTADGDVPRAGALSPSPVTATQRGYSPSPWGAPHINRTSRQIRRWLKPERHYGSGR